MFLALKAMSSLIYIYCSEINCRAFNCSIARGTRIIYFKEYCKKKLNKKGRWETKIDEPFQSKEIQRITVSVTLTGCASGCLENYTR